MLNVLLRETLLDSHLLQLSNKALNEKRFQMIWALIRLHSG